MQGDKTYEEIIEIAPQVKEALAEERPVIALESTLIAHGFPYPQNNELEEGEYNRILDRLIRETEREGISGRDITPYLLRRIKEETAGESVSSNIALIENNLKVGIEIVTA